jgi:hypothetical protein
MFLFWGKRTPAFTTMPTGQAWGRKENIPKFSGYGSEAVHYQDINEKKNNEEKNARMEAIVRTSSDRGRNAPHRGGSRCQPGDFRRSDPDF